MENNTLQVKSDLKHTTMHSKRNESSIIDNIIYPMEAQPPTRVNERTQINVFQMEDDTSTSTKYQAFFAYEDLFSGYVVLKPLENSLNNDCIPEITSKLVDIFSIIGAPKIIQSVNGVEFSKKLVDELRTIIPDLDIAHEDTVNCNFPLKNYKELLESWKSRNPSTSWHEGLYMIQIAENVSQKLENHESRLGKTPAEIFFNGNSAGDIARLMKNNQDWEYGKIQEDERPIVDKMSEKLISNEIIVNKTTQSINSDGQDSDNINDSHFTLSTSSLSSKLSSSEKSITSNVIQNENFYHSNDSKTFNINKTINKDNSVIIKIEGDEDWQKSENSNELQEFSSDEKLKIDELDIDEFNFEKIKHEVININYEQSGPSREGTEKIKNEETNDENPLIKTINENQLMKEINKKKLIIEQTNKNKTKNVKSSGKYSSLDCEYCKKKFPYRSALERHIRTHTRERPYSCKVCNKSFMQLKHLSKHLMTHSIHRSNYCAICDINFKSLQILKRHIDTHINPSSYNDNEKKIKSNRLFECDTCKKIFTSKCDLQRHILTHTNQRDYSCKICDKKFKQNSHLRSHLLTHGEKIFDCIICKESFTLSQSLRLHMLMHTRQKLYLCDICGKEFVDKHDFDGHLLSHTDEKPHVCIICNEKYTHADSLKRHINSVHKNERLYQCEICSKMFKQIGHLTSHERIHDDKRPFECHICKKTYKYKHVYKTHMMAHLNLHPFKCDTCKAKFTRKTSLKQHISSAHMNLRPHTCHICNKTFKQTAHLKGHLATHSNYMAF